MMPFKSFGRVLGLLCLVTFILLSASVAPAYAVANRVPVTDKATPSKRQVVVLVGAPRTANYVSRLYVAALTNYYAIALGDVENYSVQAGAALREEPYPFPLPIAVSYIEYPLTAPQALPVNLPMLASGGRPNKALVTKYRKLMVRYATGHWV